VYSRLVEDGVLVSTMLRENKEDTFHNGRNRVLVYNLDYYS